MTIKQLNCDVAIFGGGVAGLWLLSRLRQQGYQAILFENQALGAGQTRFAQGIIHGGTKYALLGKITASSESISSMPKLWRDCIAGQGQLDLTPVKVLSTNQCMWSNNALSSKMAGFFASKLMRSRTEELKQTNRPITFQDKNFKGKVYNLDEPVLDTASIVRSLAGLNPDAIMYIKSLQCKNNDSLKYTVEDVEGTHWQVTTQKTVLMAGQGNKALLNILTDKTQISQQPDMQLRPLKMVMLRGDLPEKIYAHCLEVNVNPRLTITSHEDSHGEIVWYMGGQIAEEGIERSDSEQISFARKELDELMPWLDFSKAQWACIDINRAEPKIDKGKRPDTSFFAEQFNIITAWPTKLALAPRLANDIESHLKNSHVNASGLTPLDKFIRPDIAQLPWLEESRWRQQ